MFNLKTIMKMTGLNLTDEDFENMELIFSEFLSHKDDVVFIMENIREISEGMIYFKEFMKHEQNKNK